MEESKATHIKAIKAIIYSPPTLLCHKVARSSFDVEVANAAAAAVVIVGDWNVEKPAAELLIW